MIRSFRLAALTAFAGLALAIAPSADAAFSYTSTVTGVSVGGVAQTLTPSGSGNAINLGGVQINFTNDTNSFTNATLFTSAVGVALSGTLSSETNNIVVTTTISITNNGVTGAFVQTSSYSLLSVPGTVPTGSYTLVSSGSTTVSPTSQPIDGNTFSVFSANATSADTNTTASITATFRVTPNAVPEPASVAMLGLGLIGTVGFAARRRLAV